LRCKARLDAQYHIFSGFYNLGSSNEKQFDSGINHGKIENDAKQK
jgi:hypothetical protein